MAKKTKTRSASKKKQDYKSKDYKKAYERAAEIVSDSAYTYAPYVANTFANFRQTIGDIDAWLRTSTPFRKSSGGRGSSPFERRLNVMGNTLFEGLKKDVKEKRFVGFKHLNESIEDMISGMHETGFDDKYDAENTDEFGDYGDSSNISSGSFDGLDTDTYIEGQAVSAQVTVDAMSMATDALSNAQFSASDYSAKRIVAGTNSAIAHVLKSQAASADILNAINQNLGSLVEQNSRVDAFHSQALSFFENTESKLNEMLDLMREQVDPVESRANAKYSFDDSDFLSGGFDPGKLAKNVWEKSLLGMLAKQQLTDVQPYLALFGIDVSKITGAETEPISSVAPIKDLFKKTPIFRQLMNLNDQMEAYTKMLFHRLNDNETFSNNKILNEIISFGSQWGLFGGSKFKSGKTGYLNLGNYDKGVARLTGKTLKSIEMVIPDYLSNIESDINALLTGFSTGHFVIGTYKDKTQSQKSEEQLWDERENLQYKINRRGQRYYDYEEGKFYSRERLENRMQEDEDSNFAMSFNEIASLMKSFTGEKMTDDTAKKFNKFLVEYGNGKIFKNLGEARSEFIKLLLESGFDEERFGSRQNAENAANALFTALFRAADSYAETKKRRNESMPGSVNEHIYNDFSGRNKKNDPDINKISGSFYDRFDAELNPDDPDAGKGFRFKSSTQEDFDRVSQRIDLDILQNIEGAAEAKEAFDKIRELYAKMTAPDVSADDLPKLSREYNKKKEQFQDTYSDYAVFNDNQTPELLRNFEKTDRGFYGIKMATGRQLFNVAMPYIRAVFGENPFKGGKKLSDVVMDIDDTINEVNSSSNETMQDIDTIVKDITGKVNNVKDKLSGVASSVGSRVSGAVAGVTSAADAHIPSASVYIPEDNEEPDTTNNVDAPVKEMRTSQGADLNIKSQTNDRIRRARDFATQRKEMLMEMVTNIRTLAGNAEYQRLKLFGSDGVLPKIWRFATVLIPMAKRFLFGDKDENGYYKGGLFGPTLANKAIDAKKFAKYKLFGTGYTNYKQETFADSDTYLFKPIQEGVDTFKNNLYSSTMGSDFANSNIYKALPNALKRRDDRRITLKSAATNEVGEDGIAKDTYDYSKWKVLPKSKAKIHGWVWNSDTNTWEMEYEYGGAVQRSRPDGFDLNNPAQLPLPPATEAILNAINSLAPVTGSHEGGTTSGAAPQKIGDVLKDDTAVDSEDVADDVKSKIASTVDSFFGNKSKGSKTKSIIGGVIGFMASGSLPGALIGAAIGSGTLSKPASALHKTIFGDYKRKESTTFAGKILNTASLGLKKVANFGLTILGATVGFMAGGPVGALVGGSIGHGAFKQGGLKNALFGGKDKNGDKQKGVVPSAAGSAFGGIGKLFKKFNDNTKGSGVIAPILGATMGAAFGIPGLLLGGMAGKAVGSGVNKFKDWATTNAGTNPDKVFKNDSLTSIEEEVQEAQVSMPDIVQDSTDDIIAAINATTNAVKSTREDSSQNSTVDALFNGSTSEDYSESGPEYREEPSLSSEWKSAVDNIFNTGTSYDYDEYDAEDDEYVGSGPGDSHLKTEVEAQKAQIEVPDLIEKASDDIVFALHSEFETDRKERVKRRQRDKEAEENEFSMARGKRDEKEASSASYDGTDNEKEDEPKKESFLSKLFGSFSKIGTIAKLAIGTIVGAGLIGKIMDSTLGDWIKEKSGELFSGIGNLIGSAIEKIDWSGVIESVKNGFGTILSTVGGWVDELTGNRTNFGTEDDNGNKKGNALSEMAGVWYDYETDPETGEVTAVKHFDPAASSIAGGVADLASSSVVRATANAAIRESGGIAISLGKNTTMHLSSIPNVPSAIANGVKAAGAKDPTAKGILGKIISKLKNFFNGFMGSVDAVVVKRYPSAATASSDLVTTAGKQFDDCLSDTRVINAIAENEAELTKATEEASAKGVAKTFAIAFTAAFATYGAVSGASWKANDLFMVKEVDVDPYMRIVSGFIEAVEAADPTMIFAVLEIVFNIIYTVSGFNIRSWLALQLYKIVVKDSLDSLQGGDELAQQMIDAVEKAQKDYESTFSAFNAQTGADYSIQQYQNATEKNVWDYNAEGRAAMVNWATDTFVNPIRSFFGLSEKEHVNWQTERGKRADELRQLATYADYNNTYGQTYDVSAMYQNMSVEDMSASGNTGGGGTRGTSEGYGSPSVGYGKSSDTHFSQLDKTWRDVSFGKMRSGKTTTIGTGGCGPTALANVARSLTGNRNITPTTVANMAQDYGYTANGGSAASLFTEGANRLGLSSQRISTKDIPSRLAAGQKIIVSGKKKGSKSPYTSAGHIISLNGVKNGKAVVDDPLKSNTEIKNIGDVMSGAKKAWVIGNGSVGYGTLDDYISNLESMGYGFDADGNLLEINDENFKNHLINGYPVNTGTTYPDGVFFQQGSWGSGYSSESAKAWAGKDFGGSNYADSGCFPTAFANVFSSLTKMDIDPMLVIDAFKSHWNGANYQWDGYSDMLNLLYGAATVAHEDELLDAGFISTHKGNQYVPTGWDGLSNEDKINEAMRRVGETLSNGGGVWIDAFNAANVYSGKSHPGGHAIAMYGFDYLNGSTVHRSSSDTIHGGASLDDSDDTGHSGGGGTRGSSSATHGGAGFGESDNSAVDDAITTILDPGRSYSSGYGAVKFSLSKLRSDLNSGRIKRITTFPYVEPSRKYEGISAAFEKFNGKYSLRGKGGDATAGRRSENSDYVYDIDGNEVYEESRNTSSSGDLSTTSNPFSIYKNQSELDLEDTSLMGKISNLGTILSKIAMNMFNTLDGSAYESVFSGSLGSNGSGNTTLGLDDYRYGDDSVAGVNSVPQYIMIRNPRTGSLAYLDVANIDINDDESLTRHAQSVLASWYDDYDGTKHSEQLSGIKNQIKNAIKNNEYANGKYLKVETPDGQTRYVPSWITRENAVIQLKDAIKQDGYYVGDDDAIIAAWEDAKAKLSRTGYFTRDGSTFAESDIVNGINKNEYKTVSVIPSYATSAGPGSTYPEYATTASGLTPYRQQSRTVSSKLSDSVLDSMADYIIPMQHAHESGTDYGKVAHLTWNNEPYLTVGTGWYAENGAEVLGRISKAPELSEDKRMLAASYAAKLLKIPESGLKDNVENFLRQSDVASVNKNVQLAMQREYNRDIYMKTPIAYYDNGTLKDPRSIMQLAEFAGIAPNATSHYAYLGTDSASTDLARTRDVLLNRWTKYTGWQNRIKDDYDLLTNVYNNHTYTSWQTGDTYDDFPSNVRQTINKALGDSVGYGDLNISDFDGDDTMSRMLGKSMGFGNPYTTNNNTRNSMSFASTRRYSPTANISADDNSTTNTNVNVNLSHIENGTDRMIALLERIVTNTGIKQPVAGNTTIINNNHESTGYGNADNQKSNTNVAVNRDEKINNVKKDRFRKMHDMVAKSPRATVR